MGFFSSIRKLFGGDTAPTPGGAAEQEAALHQTPADSATSPDSDPALAGMSGISGKAAEPAQTIDSGETQASVKQDEAQTTAGAPSPEDDALTLALRNAQPKLSSWLNVVLEGVDSASDLLWYRITFLLRALEAPEDEIEKFVTTFRKWLKNMGYEKIDEFRSELQYRLALSLDLEDEEDERSRLMLKLGEGLAKTRAQLSRSLNVLFAADRLIDEDFWEELEETLLMADVGYATASGLVERLRKHAETKGLGNAHELRAQLRQEMINVFTPLRRITAVNPPEVILMIGVNGAGKTTTIAKLCHREQARGRKVMLVAGDTFRAAATEQLGVWAERTGALFYAKGHGADPAAVAYEAMDKAMEGNVDVMFVDTAGRLHTKTNLMEELTKIKRVLGKRHEGAPHRTILVLDATTGQNALQQVKQFNEASQIDDIILTKLDGTAKGGVAVAIGMQYNIPISFVGLGEKMEDLRPFDATGFVDALLGFEDEQPSS